MFRQDLFEPDHDPGMMAPGVAPGPAAGGRQTGDQRLDQTLFHGLRDLGMRQDLGLCLGDATDLREQAPQAHRNTRGGLQSSPLRWQSERRSGECPAITFELRRVHRDHVLDGVSRR